MGRAIREPDGRICAYVAPHLVDEESPLAGVEDVFNGIVVKGDAIGDVMFYGRGAGKLPTASAVVADVMDAARHIQSRKRMEWGPGGDDVTVSPDHLVFRWYVRAEGEPETVRSSLPHAELLPGAAEGEVAFLTPEMTRAQAEAAAKGLKVRSLFRVLE